MHIKKVPSIDIDIFQYMIHVGLSAYSFYATSATAVVFTLAGIFLARQVAIQDSSASQSLLSQSIKPSQSSSILLSHASEPCDPQSWEKLHRPSPGLQMLSPHYADWQSTKQWDLLAGTLPINLQQSLHAGKKNNWANCPNSNRSMECRSSNKSKNILFRDYILITVTHL